MQTRVLAGVGVFLVAALGGYLLVSSGVFVPDRAADAEAADVEDARATAAVERAAEDRVYALDADNTEVVFTASSGLGEQTGFFMELAGEAIVSADNKLKALDVVVQTASVLTNAESLTKKLKAEAGFFDVENFPEATFVMTALEPATDVEEATHQLTGNFKIKATEKSITVPATVNASEEQFKLETEFSVNRQDFGLDFEGGGAWPDVRDLVLLNIGFELKAESRAPAAENDG